MAMVIPRCGEDMYLRHAHTWRQHAKHAAPATASFICCCRNRLLQLVAGHMVCSAAQHDALLIMVMTATFNCI
jgi:hypothetical protein